MHINVCIMVCIILCVSLYLHTCSTVPLHCTVGQCRYKNKIPSIALLSCFCAQWEHGIIILWESSESTILCMYISLLKSCCRRCCCRRSVVVDVNIIVVVAVEVVVAGVSAAAVYLSCCSGSSCSDCFLSLLSLHVAAVRVHVDTLYFVRSCI